MSHRLLFLPTHFPLEVNVTCTKEGINALVIFNFALADDESVVMYVPRVVGPPFVIKAADGSGAYENYFGYRRQYPAQC